MLLSLPAHSIKGRSSILSAFCLALKRSVHIGEQAHWFRPKCFQVKPWNIDCILIAFPLLLSCGKMQHIFYQSALQSDQQSFNQILWRISVLHVFLFSYNPILSYLLRMRLVFPLQQLKWNRFPIILEMPSRTKRMECKLESCSCLRTSSVREKNGSHWFILAIQAALPVITSATAS